MSKAKPSSVGPMVERAAYGLTMAALVFFAGNQSNRADAATEQAEVKAAQVEQKAAEVEQLEQAQLKTIEGFREYIFQTYAALERCSCEGLE